MRVLIAIKPNQAATAAWQTGQTLCQLLPDVSLTLLTVVDHESERPSAQEWLSTIAARISCAPARPAVAVETAVGQPGAAIVLAAEESATDLLILGRHVAHGLLDRLFDDNLIVHLLANAPCSVLIAKQPLTELHHLLLCDSGGHAEPLLAHLLERLPAFLHHAAELTILHVMSQISAAPGIAGVQLRASAAELIEKHSPESVLLDQNRQLLPSQTLHLHPKIRHGFVVDEIEAECEEAAYDMVIIGAHQAEGWASLLLEDLARKIVARVSQAILILR